MYYPLSRGFKNLFGHKQFLKPLLHPDPKHAPFTSAAIYSLRKPMKQLLLMRHAKSDWTSPAATDFERPLNSRGERDVPRMAALLKACDMVPQCLLASPALRARQTAEGVGAVLGIKPTFNPDLYLASLETLVGTLEKQPTELESIMLVGHNPGMAELLQRLVGGLARLPTAGLALIDFATDRWTDIDKLGGELQWFVNPRLVKAVAGEI
jgi:phosphohistidine phosphatase